MYLLINKISLFLLHSSFVIKTAFIVGFFAVIITIFDIFTPNSYDINPKEGRDLSILYRDIATIMDRENIISKCAKIICNSKELQKIAYASHDKYAIFATCRGIACYEFIRELEDMPFLFITEARSFNVERLDSIDSNVEQWQEDILIGFELQKNIY